MMAYSNWGAWVYRNDEHDPGGEDASITPKPAGEPNYGVYHAVLGSGQVRLCGYKCYPQIVVNGETLDSRAFRHARDIDDDEDWSDYRAWSGEVDEHLFAVEPVGDNDNMIDMLLIEPDGTRWTARCGFDYGAGFDYEDPRNRVGKSLDHHLSDYPGDGTVSPNHWNGPVDRG